jgi:hypothetical protein
MYSKKIFLQKILRPLWWPVTAYPGKGVEAISAWGEGGKVRPLFERYYYLLRKMGQSEESSSVEPKIVYYKI